MPLRSSIALLVLVAAASATASPGRSSIPSGDPLVAIERELRDAPDLKAAYEKYKGLPDPTGRISYRLAEWIGDCPSYIHESPEEMDRYFRVTPEMRANARRNEVMERVVARCNGFNLHDRVLTTRYSMQVWQELHERALQAGYPGARARALMTTTFPARPSAGNDQIAIGLLSGPVDAEVIKYVGQYIHVRNGRDWPAYGFVGRAIWFSAWSLLECDFGADCGPNSRLVQVYCTHYGYCGMTGIEDVLLVQSAMTQQRLQVADDVRAALLEMIRNRDWVGLGFRPRQADQAK